MTSKDARFYIFVFLTYTEKKIEAARRTDRATKIDLREQRRPKREFH